MKVGSPLPAAYTFGDLVVDCDNFRLLKRGQVQPIEPRAFDVLIFLIEHRDRVVEKPELFDQVWQQSFVTDSALAQEIKNIRQAIGDDAKRPRYIETVRKHGYRFIGAVEEFPSTRVTESVSTRARIVVLPFVHLDCDSEKEYLSDAFTEEFITELAALAPEDLLVIARTTAMHYKHTDKQVGQICSELNVDYLVQGAVRHEDNHIAITLQLIRASDQMHLLSRRYESDIQHFFNLRTEVAEAIATAIGITRRSDLVGQRRRKQPTDDPVALTFYLKARFLEKTPETFPKAKAYYEEAISRDPNFALPYDAIAELYWYLGFFGVASPKDVSAAGMIYATRALELDPTEAETHALLAMYRIELNYDWGEVKREMDLARQLNSESPVVRVRYAIFWLMPEYRLDQAVSEIELALESDPQSTFIRAWLTVMLWFNRHYDQAVEEADIMIKLDPQAYLGYWMLSMVDREHGRFEEAIESQRKAVARSGGAPLQLGWLGLALGQAGKAAEARAVLDQLHELAKTKHVPPSSFGWTYFGLGELDEAFVWLDRAVDGRDHMMIPIKCYPFFDTIRDDPRYLSLLRKMNFNTDGPGTNCRAMADSRSLTI
jgi:TolB-like protein/Tfp pilus assembly protein PilF